MKNTVNRYYNDEIPLKLPHLRVSGLVPKKIPFFDVFLPHDETSGFL